VSDSGSGMGARSAVKRGQSQSSCRGWMRLTCGNALQQRLCRVARSVRIEVQRPSPRPDVTYSSAMSYSGAVSGWIRALYRDGGIRKPTG
jgi:hypothetical protein